MPAENEVRMKIEDDGTITVKTEGFEGGEAHLQAEELIKTTFETLGGEAKVIKRKDGPHRAHTHTHGTGKQHVGH